MLGEKDCRENECGCCVVGESRCSWVARHVVGVVGAEMQSKLASDGQRVCIMWVLNEAGRVTTPVLQAG